MLARSAITRGAALRQVARLHTSRPVFAAKQNIPTAHHPNGELDDKLLFTPGPLTTSYSVKAAALHDYGSRDGKFIKVIKDVRSGLLKVAGVSEAEFTAIPMQGSGTYGVEATVTSTVPANGKLLVIANGAYGSRIGTMCKYAKVPHTVLNYAEDQQPILKDIEGALTSDKGITHVAVIHSETTSGIINDIESIGQIVNKHGKSFIVDAMSSFGAVPIDFSKAKIDYLVSSANKCIEGLPGFSFAIARKSALNATKGNARSLALDIHSQNEGLDKSGQFRFTPPTHAMLAFRQALTELELEGGVSGRAARYKANRDIILNGMQKLGFVPYLKDRADSGYIITSFRYPTSPNWDFEAFYTKLSHKNFLIYPGKVTNADCFRIGHIGRIFPEDSTKLMRSIEQVVQDMKLFK